MPQPDQRRINGPEISFPYRVHSQVNLKTYEQKLADVLGSTGQRRTDGRQIDEPRKIFLKSKVTSQAKGSAYIELGATKVIVSVFDPREIPKQNAYSLRGQLYCDFKFAPFAAPVVRRSPQTDVQEKSLAFAMRRALNAAVCLHEFANFQVDVFACVLQDDGGVLGAAITAAGLALADAGIPMFDVITATTVGCLSDGRLLADPSAVEEDLCTHGSSDDGAEHGLVMMARLAEMDQVTELWQTGSLRLDTLRRMNGQLLETNAGVVQIVKQIMVRKVLSTAGSAADVESERAMEQLRAMKCAAMK